MRIAVWHNLPSGGGKRALYYHVGGLLERGHEVEAWCPPTADRQYLPLQGLVDEHVVPLEWPAPGRAPRGLRRLQEYRELTQQLAAMERHCQACAEEMNRRGFDVLFANACRSFRTTPIGRYVSFPKVLYLGEPNRPLYEAMPTLPWPAPPAPEGGQWSLGRLRTLASDLIRVQSPRLQVREERRNAAAFDRILVNSLYSRESVLRAYGLEASVCYLGVDTDLFVDRGGAREPLVVGIGAFVPEKNIPLVVEALALVPEPRPALVWVGNHVHAAGYLDVLGELARSRGVAFEPRVRIEDGELVDVLNRAAMMVYAPRLEPFGFAPLEAASCGLPVVAVPEGGVRESVVDGLSGLLVEADPGALAAAVGRLAGDPSLARRLGRQARELVVERWSLGAAIERLERRLAAVAFTSAPNEKIFVVEGAGAPSGSPGRAAARTASPDGTFSLAEEAPPPPLSGSPRVSGGPAPSGGAGAPSGSPGGRPAPRPGGGRGAPDGAGAPGALPRGEHPRGAGAPSGRVRLLAFYLPQFHPIPENDEWWGKGFTEWTNVARAKPLFPGHYQPHLPADLGFYDLRLPETAQAQAELAERYGLAGFCYWHYWFGGKRLLERPFDQALTLGRPDFPFCLAWANESWSRRWLGEDRAVLMRQTYAEEDDREHARWLIRAFEDRRYVRVGGRPLFLIYRPRDLPHPQRTAEVFRSECVRRGVAEPYLVGINGHAPDLDCRTLGFDGTVDFEPQLAALPDHLADGGSLARLRRNLRHGVLSSRLKVCDYRELRFLTRRMKKDFPVYSCAFVGWDNTPRRGRDGIVVVNSKPSHFEAGLADLVRQASRRPDDQRIVFVNAWNEWAEGNHLEPDLKHGLAYLEAVRRVSTAAGRLEECGSSR
jgi:glycosyltransferase involved in cell wall biosynthesis